MNSHLILIGFMGSGKSTVGQELANRLQVPFFDTDQEIEKEAKEKISDIFRLKGEAAFREIETKTFKHILMNHDPSVISTGGGMVLSEENRSLMENHVVVLLEASIGEVFRRLQDDINRPLLQQNEDRFLGIRQLYEKRKEFYDMAAKLKITTDDKTIEQIVEEIISAIK